MPSSAAPAPSPRPLWLLALLGVLLAALVGLLLALGSWQVQRLAWKRDLIARVEARVHAAPGAFPQGWSSADTARDEYRRVRLSGRFLAGQEAAVQAVTELGPGFWILAPLQLADGRVVLVNRGYVPSELRDPASRPLSASAPEGEVEITGLLRMSEPGGGFLRDNDPEANRWFSRDVAAIAAAQGLGEVAPWFVDAEGGELPRGGLTVIAFRNNHLPYAATWFALAFGLIGAGIWVARDEIRLRAQNRPR